MYANDLSPAQVAQGFAVVEEQVRWLGLWFERTWGPALEEVHRGRMTGKATRGNKVYLISCIRAW